MATIDEILDAMPEEDAATGRDYLVIDPAARTITVPASERIFGVEGDEDAARKYFICPRYVGDNLDLASMFLTVNYRNANGEEDGYLVNDVQVDGDYVTFSWKIEPKAVAYKGVLQFAVCADLPNTATKRRPDWNTTLAEGEVLEGMDPDRGDVEGETSDVVTQLRAEIAASTAAVEAAGAAQVDVVKAAGAAATATAQAQIEAKGAATLATIPADYTTLANKTNEQANAIKGHLAGEIVQAGDVSPVEHYLGVKVHGKNFFNIGALEVTSNGIDNSNITEIGPDYFVINTPEAHTLTSYTSTGKSLRELFPGLVVGRTYTLTAETDSANNPIMYLTGVKVSWRFGQYKEITEAMLEAHVVFYGFDVMGGENYGNCTISKVQLEEGTVATEYTPYIDPATVTVKRCSKNLIDSALMAETKTLNGVTITREGDLLTLNGTLTTDSVLFSTPFCFHGGLDNWYTLSYKHMGGTATGSSSVCVGDCETPGAARQSWANIKMLNEDNAFACKMVKPFVKDLWFYATAGVSFENYKIKIQLETGKTATAFAPCNGTTAMPASDGTVTGLPSVAPSMALITDTAGVNIECTYNRDSNAVYAELLAKIAALGGNN